MSKKALKNGHAEHIHGGCDCSYAVRFDSNTTVAGYDPDKLQEQYYAAGSTRQERLNAMRREHYAANKDGINEQKRLAYSLRKPKSIFDVDMYDSFSKIEVFAEGTDNKDPEGRFDRLPEDRLERMEALNSILNDYCKRDSLWNHVLNIVDPDEMPYAWGKSNPDLSITVLNSAKTKTFIHELLHMRSSKHYSGTGYYDRFKHLEEGSVELFAQELCRANGINFYMSYQQQTRHLRIINSIINPEGKEGIYGFSKELFDIDPPNRYSWLRGRIRDAKESGAISSESFRIANRHLVDLLNGK